LFARLKAESLTVVPITREHFLAAALLVDQYDIGLRAGDALHVAIAAALGATICTLDKRLSDAAVAVNALLV
jgi:predicted nucleic acid-binding protein